VSKYDWHFTSTNVTIKAAPNCSKGRLLKEGRERKENFQHSFFIVAIPDLARMIEFQQEREKKNKKIAFFPSL
jgi:hypothetical protein